LQDPCLIFLCFAAMDPCLIFLCFAAMVSFLVGIMFDQGLEWLEGVAILCAELEWLEAGRDPLGLSGSLRFSAQ
ncbi:hypothetical protein T484DRAFT_1788313, partial [Baffinella frigidus]